MTPDSSPTGTTIDTVLGQVTVNRAWCHCAACKHGLAPRDAELGVAGTSLSPGLTEMNERSRLPDRSQEQPGCWRTSPGCT
jgi:hypothetical protein